MENQNELYHHGIKGQRWGIRRFQNKDGTLTKAGQRRAAKLEAEYEKVTGNKVFSSSSSSKFSGKKNIKNMTDDELIERTNRLNAEKNYMEAQKNHISAQTQLSSLQPKQTNKGKELVKEVFDDVIKPAAKNVGKQYLEKMLKEATGIDSKNSIDALAKEAEKAGYMKKIYEAKDAAYKNLKNERQEAEYQANKKKARDDEKAAEENKKRSAEEYSKETGSSPNQHSYRKKYENNDKKVYSGTVEGEGTSRRTEKSKFSKDDIIDVEWREINRPAIYKGKNFVKDDIIDVEWREVNKATVNEGQRYLTTKNILLLEDKSMKHSGEIMEEGDKMNELYHHGVKGMKWGVRKTHNTRMKNEMYKTNKKISSDFKKSKGKSDSYEKTMAYVGNKSAQLYLRRKDRAKMHEDIGDPNKNRGLSIGKAFVKTYLKDMAVSSIPASAVAIGVSTITANPFLGMYAGSLVGQASSLGVAGTRIYNTAKNK